jgi:hypothetical protein
VNERIQSKVWQAKNKKAESFLDDCQPPGKRIKVLEKFEAERKETQFGNTVAQCSLQANTRLGSE